MEGPSNVSGGPQVRVRCRTAIFLTVLHRLFVSGSDRCCDKWQRDLVVSGSEDLKLHHLYRAMSFLGEEIADQRHCSAFTPRCTKDVIEEELFAARRDLFTGLDCVFFDTTSIYFEVKVVIPSESTATPRITGLISSRWWWVLSLTTGAPGMLRDVAGQHDRCQVRSSLS